MHADHITGSGEIKDRLNEKAGNSVVSIISAKSGARADVHLTESQVITCGESINLHVLSTPGISLHHHCHCIFFSHTCASLALLLHCDTIDFSCSTSSL